MKRLLLIIPVLLLFNSCVSTFLIPDRMVNTELGSKVQMCLNQDESYVKRQFGNPTKEKEYDSAVKMLYYEEWGHWNTKKIGNTQYYTDYRFIKFQIDPEGYVEDYVVSKGYTTEYNANNPLQTVVFWVELIGYSLIAGAIGIF